MREISLTILDITQNSIEAQATKIAVEINENTRENFIVVEIRDNGNGIDEKDIKKVMDPFYTSRKTRKVGMGLSIFQAMCERSGGSIHISSEMGNGTSVKGTLEYNNLDRPPIGRIEDTISGMLLNTGIEIEYIHRVDDKSFCFNSREIRRIAGEEAGMEVINWVRDYIRENLENIGANLWS